MDRPTLLECRSDLNLDLSPALLGALDERGLRTLDDIRNGGGLHHLRRLAFDALVERLRNIRGPVTGVDGGLYRDAASDSAACFSFRSNGAFAHATTTKNDR